MTKSILVLLVKSMISGVQVRAATSSGHFFSGCGLEQYYGDLPGEDIEDWRRKDLRTLLKKTHRNVLPFSHGAMADVSDALEELDLVGKDAEETSVSMATTLDNQGTPLEQGWNVSYLWPKDKGIGESGKDATDIHNLRLSSPEEVALRQDLLYGTCGLACDVDVCKTFQKGDMASDGVIFLPPKDRRGDIARALFYMELRYSALQLADCPSGKSEMGYLSQLLAWHEEDPPDDEERTRNLNACQYWQGNRNPFVDAPYLITLLIELRDRSCTDYPPNHPSSQCFEEEPEVLLPEEDLEPFTQSLAYKGQTLGLFSILALFLTIFFV